MKKAKVVDVPLDRPLTTQEHGALASHAHSSALWYAMQMGKNTFQIREKLWAKGYPRDPVQVQVSGGELEPHDLVEECIAELVESAVVDDLDLATSLAESLLRQGRGTGAIRTKLFQRGFPRDMAEVALGEALGHGEDDAEAEALALAGERLLRSPSLHRLDSQKARQKLVRTLASRGFPLDAVFAWVSDNWEQ